MQKKVHEKKSASQLFSQSLHRPRFSMISDICSTQDCKQNICHKRTSQAMDPCRKSFLLHDDEYNSMIYEWRKVETAPIVKVFMVCKDHDIDGRTGEIIVKNIVRAEKIVKKLTDLSDLSVGQSLHILKNMLQGHQTIYKKLGATTISLEKCGLNEKGQLKVWVNQNFIRNQMSGEVLCAESRIVSRIFEIIDMVTEKKLNNFRNFVIRNVEASNWSFLLMDRIIQDYVKSLKIQIPNSVRGLSGVCTMKRISNRVDRDENYKRGASSLKCSPRSKTNIQSSLNFTTKSPQISQQKRSIKSQIYDSNPIKKSYASTKNTTDSQIETTICKKQHSFIQNRPQFELLKIPIGEMRSEEEETDGFLTQRKDKFQVKKQYDHFYIPENPPMKEFMFKEKKSEKSRKKILKQSQISTENPGSNYQEQNKCKQLQKFSKRPSVNLKINMNDTFGRCCFKQLKNNFPKLTEEFQSYENTEKNSSERDQFAFQNKFDKTGENRIQIRKPEVLFATHIPKNEENTNNKHPSKPRSSLRKSEQQIALEQALQNLLTSAKEQEVLEHNSWTKKLDGLFTHEINELKQSISYETSDENKKKCGKLTELSKWGRDVQESQIPE